MPAPIAFLGCLAFVLFTLRMEHKEAKGVTAYLWVPTIWFLILASRSLAMWFGVGGETIEEGSIVDQFVNLGLAGIALIILAKRRFSWSLALRRNGAIIALLIFMLVSTIWSEIPFVSFRRWVTYAIAMVMIFSVQTEPNPRAAAEAILRRIVYICIPFSYLTIHYFQQYGKIYVHSQGVEMWTGVAIHKNSLAELCLISFMVLTWRIVTRRKSGDTDGGRKLDVYFDAAILIITLLIFMGPNRSITYSATTLMSTLIGFATFGFLRWYQRRGRQPAMSLLIAGTVFLIAYGTITPFLGKLSLLDVSGALGRSSSLTGRTEVWASLMPAVSESPLLGYGVGGFWTTHARELYDISGAHNGYLGEILEGGFIGMLLLSLFLLSITKTAHRISSIDPNWSALCLMFLFAILGHNMGEESINSLTARLTSVLVLLSITCHGVETTVIEETAIAEDGVINWETPAVP
jgi:exopolysaccharide production protein ExoQ